MAMESSLSTTQTAQSNNNNNNDDDDNNNTVEHIYDAVSTTKYSELGNFPTIAYLYVSDGSRC